MVIFNKLVMQTFPYPNLLLLIQIQSQSASIARGPPQVSFPALLSRAFRSGQS